MFDFAWSEIALIGIVALIAIGPKDMPVAIRAVTQMIKKARRMASEFQTHVDEMVREANLDEVRSQINEIRSMDIKGTVERAVDPDGALRSGFAANPLATAAAATTVAAQGGAAADKPADADAAHDPAAAAEEKVAAPPPAFIPPSFGPAIVVPAPAAAADEPPAFIPPGVTRH